MSSREIAELTNSRHDSVKRSMERMASSLVISITPTVEPTAGGGKPITIYHVTKRDIESMLNELKLDASKFGVIYFDAQNRKQTEYKLDRNLTLTLVSGYNIKLRHAIIERLDELSLDVLNFQGIYLVTQIEARKTS